MARVGLSSLGTHSRLAKTETFPGLNIHVGTASVCVCVFVCVVSSVPRAGWTPQVESRVPTD